MWKDSQHLISNHNYDEAAATLAKLIPLQQQLLGKENIQLATTWTYLAAMHLERAKYEAAADAFSNVLEIKTAALGKDHWQVTDARLSLADCKTLVTLPDEKRKQWLDANKLIFELKDLQAATKSAMQRRPRLKLLNCTPNPPEQTTGSRARHFCSKAACCWPIKQARKHSCR